VNQLNKSALKTFAIEARKELIERVTTRAMQLGITNDSIAKATIESSDAIIINGKHLNKEEVIQRNKLINRIKDIGFDRVVDEVSYTWFNRLTALRFMEVNDYLPTRTRVLSSEGILHGEPDMMKEALTLDLDLDKELVYELMVNNETDELFKYLIKAHCNDLNRYMPFMFETIEDYTAILFPDGLLTPDSFLRKMTNTEVIPEDNWEKIEVIGWLYQYYIAEEKDRVFKAKKKYKSAEIPYATQLFTPDWIVQYMVQNSLGKKWIESHPEHKELQDKWEFYLENPDENLEEKLAPYINKDLKVEDIKCFDPAMGSGHILVYMFEVLHEIYSKSGYMEREIPRLIIENNLYGLDIDDRAYQLASFSVVMKAMQYDKRFLRTIKREELKMNLAAIQETNSFTDEEIAYIAGADSGESYANTKAFVEQYHHAKSIGSLIKITMIDTTLLQERLVMIEENPATDIFQFEFREKILAQLPNLIKQTEIMSKQYDVLVTNPPYMGSGSMNKELTAYLGKYYSDSKRDLFAAFMEVDHYLESNAFYACINQHSWMFLSSYEKLRKKVIQAKYIDSMLHLGPRAFEEIGGEVVQSTAFVLRKTSILNVKGIYLRLVEENTSNKKKEKSMYAAQNIMATNRYSFYQSNFNKIPGSPIAYWVSNKMVEIFNENQSFVDYSVPRQGMATSDNNRFLRYWSEVSTEKFNLKLMKKNEAINSNYKWFPYNKGGTFRKWFGNNDLVLNWESNGEELKEFPKSVIRNPDYYFKEGLTWSSLSTGSISFRFCNEGFLFDSKGPMCFAFDESDNIYLIGMLNSKVVNEFLKILAPTLDFNQGPVAKIPTIISRKKSVEDIVLANINISMNDWNLFETSWDFLKHPLLNYPSVKIESAFDEWKQFAELQFNQIKSNEEELNRIFIEVYGLQEEITPEIENNEISIRKANLEREIKSFISYAIGCSFGRYSQDEDGLIYAGGEFDPSRYKTFKVDEDNILPILPGAYFEDDIVSRFIEFVRITFGEETLTENLDFVADALTRRRDETAQQTLRRYFMNDFYKDHVQIYKKHPIYWQFTSGKEKAFNCLIYMHRYDKSTLSRIRTDYLHEYQVRLDAEKEDLMNVIQGDSPKSEISDANRKLKSLEKKIDELKKYDEVLHHMADKLIEIDLDDGVKVNYEKFDGLVTKI